MRVSDPSKLATRAYRRPATNSELETLLGFYDKGRADRGFDGGIQSAIERMLVSSEFLFRIERDPAERRAGRRLSHQRCRSRVAPLVLPLEQHSRRRTADAGGARTAARSGGAEQQVRRMLADPALERAGRQLRRPVARPAERRQLAARSRRVPGFRREPARGVPARRPSCSSSSQMREDRSVARAADRRLHVPQRAARASTTASRTSTASDSGASRSPTTPRRPARPGQHADGDVVSGAHVAGAARQVGAREYARRAAASAAARRARL